MPGHTACLAHVPAGDRSAHLATLAPGADIDCRRTPFTQVLLDELLAALEDPVTSAARLGRANFNGAAFTEGAAFAGTTFGGRAEFEGATFESYTEFFGTTFHDDAAFDGSTFAAFVGFNDSMFHGVATFIETEFRGNAGFADTRFRTLAAFGGASFAGDAGFHGSTCDGDMSFDNVRFDATSVLGPLVCGGVDLSRAVFGEPVTLEIAAQRVTCVRTSWNGTATLRLRFARLDLTDAVLAAPVAVTAHPTPFTSVHAPALDESVIPRLTDETVRVVSLRGLDAAHLVLTDTDLTECRFTGAFHLDQVRMEGRIAFAATPVGVRWRRGIPRWWTRRRVLAEEHHWRARQLPAPPPPRGWTPAVTPPVADPGPDDLAPTYRHLRKAFEDAKNEPDAGDFYFGECEMRRLDPQRPRAERFLLTLYWVLSGYGLRASRALGWLAVAMVGTVLALTMWGLPTADPKPVTTGTQAAPGLPLRMITDTPDAVVRGSVGARFTVPRVRKASRIAANSVFFRASGQNLTALGGEIEMASRLAEPILLTLAGLAIRGRVKR